MKLTQKSNRLYKILIVLEIVSIIGIVYWFFLRPDSNPAANTSYVAECSTTIQAPTNTPTELPSGWALYEIRDIGIKYFYPANWGNPTTITNSGTKKYEADYTIKSSGAHVAVLLSQDCSDFITAISDINNNKFDTQEGDVTTKAVNHNQSSYSSMNHWTSNKGNQYKFTIYNVVNVGNIKSIAISYSVIAGKDTCPDDKLAADDQPKCINQTISGEIEKVVNSLQKFTPELN